MSSPKSVTALPPLLKPTKSPPRPISPLLLPPPQKTFECPVCLSDTNISTNAMNCKNGHSLCLECMGKISEFIGCGCSGCDGQSFQFKCPICRDDGVYDVNHIGFLLVGTIEGVEMKEKRLQDLKGKKVKRKVSKVKEDVCVKCAQMMERGGGGEEGGREFGVACGAGHSMCVECSRESLIAVDKCSCLSRSCQLHRRQNVFFNCPGCPTHTSREVLSDRDILCALKGKWSRWDGRRREVEKEPEGGLGYFTRLVGGFSGL